MTLRVQLPKNPVFIDLETRSCCDLRAKGGWNYAAHPTTSILTVSWCDSTDGVYHLWLPGRHHRDEVLHDDVRDKHLGDVVLHFDSGVPHVLQQLRDRPWVAHNAWTFDEVVWSHRYPSCSVKRWLDTYPLALACGLPGGLDRIGHLLWAEGKYEKETNVVKAATRCKNPLEVSIANVTLAAMVQVGRYNVQDVRLLAKLWDEIGRTLQMTPEEYAVLQAHKAINQRGVKLDRPLVNALIDLSTECNHRAVETICELTAGALCGKHDHITGRPRTPDDRKKDLTARNKVFAWLDSIGVTAPTIAEKGDDGILRAKKSLRREIITKWIENADVDQDGKLTDEADTGDPDDSVEGSLGDLSNLPLAAQVLELRLTALRITNAKLEAANEAVSEDGYLRGMFVYYGAHTGRWAGRRVQVHNLPRTKKGVDVWRAIEEYLATGSMKFDAIDAMLPKQRFLSPDDVASSAIRCLFLPNDGDRCVGVVDYAGIEARVLKWLAGGEDCLKDFWEGKDPYLLVAERLYGPSGGWNMDGVKDRKASNHPYRQVGKVITLGCGYQLGAVKFAIYAVSQGIDLAAAGVTAEQCVEAFRAANPAIAGIEQEFKREDGDTVKYRKYGLWGNLNVAAIKAVETPGEVKPVGKVRFVCEKGNLYCYLPSGRPIVYRKAKIVQVIPQYAKNLAIGDKRKVDQVEYESPRYKRTTLFGGKLAENVVQAVARDILAASMVRCEVAGFPIVIHVHDEPVTSLRDEGRFLEYVSLVSTPPPWLDNFPLDVEGWVGPRYAKDPPPGVKKVTYRNGRPHK